jgi:HEPN domain-containing protein
MQQPRAIPTDSPYPGWHYCHLPEARKELKERLEDALCAAEIYAVNFLTLYDKLEKLMEAAWLLLQQRAEKDKEIVIKQGEEKEQNNPLSAILTLLVAALQPERIFLLWYEEGKAVDLLVVVPDRAGKPFSHHGTIIEAACYGITEVSFSLRLSSLFRQHIEEGHPFWLTDCTKDKQVYEKDASSLPVPSPARHEEVKQKAGNLFYAGLSKAASFFESAKAASDRSDPATALFLLHQTAEFSLRALIRSLTGREVKEHSITLLAKHLRRCAPGLTPFFSTDKPEEERLLSLLESAYLKGRYADSFEVKGEDVALLLQK